MNHRAWRAGPLRKGRNIVSERGIIDLVDEDPEECGSLVTRVGFELRVDLDDERGGNGRKKSSLFRQLALVHKQFMRDPLTKIRVVFRSSSYFLRNSLSYSSATPR